MNPRQLIWSVQRIEGYYPEALDDLIGAAMMECHQAADEVFGQGCWREVQVSHTLTVLPNAPDGKDLALTLILLYEGLPTD